MEETSTVLQRTRRSYQDRVQKNLGPFRYIEVYPGTGRGKNRRRRRQQNSQRNRGHSLAALDLLALAASALGVTADRRGSALLFSEPCNLGSDRIFVTRDRTWDCDLLEGRGYRQRA